MNKIDRRGFLRASGLTSAALAMLPLAAAHRALTQRRPELRDKLEPGTTGHIQDHQTLARVLHELLDR